MTDIATNEPLKIIAGDRVKWKRSFTDYKAGDGWSLAYYLVHPTNAKITINTSADGDDHLVDVAPATTTNWVAGTYHWQAFVTKDDDRYLVDEGTLEIETNFASGSVTTFDDRSHARKVLALIEAAIEGNTSPDVQSYSIAGRTLSRYSKEDLLKLRNQYRWEVKQEEQAERIRNGLDAGANVHTRFTG